MILTHQQVIKLLGLVVVMYMSSVGVAAQVCGTSINTIFAVSDDAERIRNVKIEISELGYTEHHRLITKIIWSDEIRAYQVVHGLCGSHKAVVLEFTAEGYAPLSQSIAMPLGKRAYVLNLKRKGSKETGTLVPLSCADAPEVCAELVPNQLEK